MLTNLISSNKRFHPIRFRSMAPMYYRKANAAIIVYDITNSKSFDQAKEWVEGNAIFGNDVLIVYVSFLFLELYRNIGTDIGK